MDEFQGLLYSRMWMNKDTKIDAFTKLKNYDERIKFVFNLMHQFKIFPKTGNINKDAKVSEQTRHLGNKMFTSSCFDGKKSIEVLELYSQSIAFAPCNSKELSLAYANRSAVLLAIHKYVESIQDIDRALLLNYPDNLKPKLYVRKIECLIAIGKSIEEDYKIAMDWVERMPLNDINKEKLKIKLHQLKQQSNNQLKNHLKKNVEFFKVKSRNIEAPCASDALEIKYNDIYGRHVVATRDISIGEFVVTEKPYSIVLDKEYIRNHCFNCLNVSWASIPCDYCTHAMYCSEQCKSEDWKKSHDLECNIFPILSDVCSTPQLISLSIRMAIQATREFNNFEDLRNELNEVDQCDDLRIKGFNYNKIFESDKYRSVYSLETHVDKRGTEYLLNASITAAFVVYLLATRTTMFGPNLKNDLSALVMNKDVALVGGLIMKHLLIIPVNCHCFDEEYMFQARGIGCMVLPFHSLINHSCDPNIVRICRNFTEALSYVIRPISKGEQIYDNYGQYYPMMPKEERQANLVKDYFLECNCQPCKEDWPLYNHLPSYQVTIKDQKAKSTVASALRNFVKYMEITTLRDVINKPDLIQGLFKMLEILYDHVALPCKDICNIIENIKSVYGLHGYTFEIPVV